MVQPRALPLALAKCNLLRATVRPAKRQQRGRRHEDSRKNHHRKRLYQAHQKRQKRTLDRVLEHQHIGRVELGVQLHPAQIQHSEPHVEDDGAQRCGPRRHRRRPRRANRHRDAREQKQRRRPSTLPTRFASTAKAPYAPILAKDGTPASASDAASDGAPTSCKLTTFENDTTRHRPRHQPLHPARPLPTRLPSPMQRPSFASRKSVRPS